MKKSIYLLVTSIMLFALACKKNGSNPNIVHKVLNLSKTHTGMYGTMVSLTSLPISGENDPDKFEIQIRNSYYGDSTLILQFWHNGDGQYANTSSGLIKIYAKNETINAGSVSFWQGSSGLSSGSGGDKYIGFRFKLSDNATHYGWILINYSEDGKELIVKEAAYNKIGSEGIKAGEY